MKDFIKAIDGLSDTIKILFCLPIINIVWAIYRIAKSVEANNTLGIVLGVLWIFAGATVLWIFDLVYMIMYKKIWWIC